MTIRITGPVWYWKGPAPFYFVTVPPAESSDISSVSALASYGWGMVPVDVTIGKTTWYTALFAKDGAYIVPVKADVRRKEGIEEGDTVNLELLVRLPRSPA